MSLNAPARDVRPERVRVAARARELRRPVAARRDLPAGGRARGRACGGRSAEPAPSAPCARRVDEAPAPARDRGAPAHDGGARPSRRVERRGDVEEPRLLAEAGLVRRRRGGYYVLYELAPDALAGVATELGAYIRGVSADPTYETMAEATGGPA
jgi:hypothetical protein